MLRRNRSTTAFVRNVLAARGESLAAFDGRCILAGCVAPPLNTPGILGRRALPARRLARLGATPHFHHALLGNPDFGSSAGLDSAGHDTAPGVGFSSTTQA